MGLETSNRISFQLNSDNIRTITVYWAFVIYSVSLLSKICGICDIERDSHGTLYLEEVGKNLKYNEFRKHRV